MNWLQPRNPIASELRPVQLTLGFPRLPYTGGVLTGIQMRSTPLQPLQNLEGKSAQNIVGNGSSALESRKP